MIEVSERNGLSFTYTIFFRSFEQSPQNFLKIFFPLSKNQMNLPLIQTQKLISDLSRHNKIPLKSQANSVRAQQV